MQQTTTAAAGAAADCQADEASQFSRLPSVLLTRILQAVPQRDRLGRCSSVCKAWAAAAAAATVDVDMRPNEYRFQNSQPWLQRHVKELVSLKLQPAGSFIYVPWVNSLCKLPCREMQQLSRLDLGALELELYETAGSTSSTSSSTATAPVFPALKELKLRDCKLSRSTLLQLAQVPTITHLELQPSKWEGWVDPDAVKQLLQGLPNLAHLDLRLACTGGEADLIPALPAQAASLTALSLGLINESPKESSRLPDSASKLGQLRVLELHRAEFNPASLDSLTLLTHLSLRGCKPASGKGRVSAAAFLSAVRGMHHLQRLAVVDPFDGGVYSTSFDHAPLFLRTAQPADCAALTASSQLTCLAVSSANAQPLPATALQHMFPAGKQLPRLQRLEISTEYDDEDAKEAGRITTAELSSLVDACPALACLDLNCVLAADADVSALLKLPQQCQHLGVAGQAFGDKAAGVIGQLTQLSSLNWGSTYGSWRELQGAAPYLSAAGMLLLTELPALQTCSVPSLNCRRYQSSKRELKAGKKSVSQQLRELLLANGPGDVQHTATGGGVAG